MEEDIDRLLEELIETRRHMNFMDSQIHWQRAQIETLFAWLSRYLSQLSGHDGKELLSALEKMTRETYAKNILKIGDTHPDYARLIDIRKDLPDGQSDEWQFPEDYRPYPKS